MKGQEREKLGGCGREELLVTVLYGEASAAERAEFETHRASCASCDEELAAFARVREELGGWELGPVPAIRVEVRPGFVERLKRAFAVMPAAARLATAGACALLVLAVLNTEVAIGPDGFRFTTGIVPRQEAQVVQNTGLTEAQVERIVAERADALVRTQLAAYREDLDAQLAGLERQLVSAGSSDEVKRLSVQISAQRRKIDRLERDLDRAAGYGGADLFSMVLSPPEPGS
jgi:hypothetical protein